MTICREEGLNVKKKIIIWAAILIAVCIFLGITLYTTGVAPYDFSSLIVRHNLPAADGYDFTPLNGGASVDDMDLAMETDELAFYINQQTAGFMILDKRNSEKWYSSPTGYEQDPIANNVEKSGIASQLTIRYYDQYRRENIWTSYDESVSRKQFEVKRAGDGIRVTYTFGRLELGVDLLPQFISEERFNDRILAGLDHETSLYVRTRYVASKTKPGFFELLTMVRTSEIHSARMLAAFAKIDYTEADLEEDNRLAGVETNIEKDFIVIPVEYSLSGGHFRVNIPLDEIKESDNIKLSYIELLNFFGAGSADDDGYMLVPSGSGGLIYFNNGKTNQAAYIQKVYGTDPLFFGREVQSTAGALLPVFGIHKPDAGMVALIESGDALATVTADVSGRKNSYNYVFPSFTLRETDTMYMSGVTGTESDMRVIQDNYFQGDISILYTFLAGEESGYSDMAATLRAHFADGGGFQKLEESPSLPMYITLLGAVETKKHLVGVPFNSLEVMTTYSQAETILRSLYDRTGAGLFVRYLGWFNNGINHTVASHISLIGSLGNRSALVDLNDMLEATGGKLFPDVQFQLTAFIGNWRYSKTREASRWMDGFTARDAPIGRVLLRKNGSGLIDSVTYINSPRSVPYHVDGFIDSYSSFGLDSLSLRDLGTYLASDYRRGYTIDRETAKLVAQEQITKLDKVYPDLMLLHANCYALPYASHIVEAPLGADMYYIIDEEVPFYQMVIHGYIDYSGEAVNISDTFDERTTLLKMLEYGANPYYILTYEPSSLLDRTLAAPYYSTCYSDWADTIEEQYSVLNEINNHVRTETITAHVKRSEGVYETVYSNGFSVLVNYSDTGVTVDGIEVAPKGYAVRLGA